MVGTTGLFEFLDSRRRDEVQEFARTHPVHLPSFSELEDTFTPPPLTTVDHTTMPSTSAVDHTTAVEPGELDVDMGTGTGDSPLVRLEAPADPQPT